MKKLILFTYCFFAVYVLQAQVDSTQFVNAISMGIPIALKLINVPIISGVPNDILKMVLASIGAFLWGWFHSHIRTSKKKDVIIEGLKNTIDNNN